MNGIPDRTLVKGDTELFHVIATGFTSKDIEILSDRTRVGYLQYSRSTGKIFAKRDFHHIGEKYEGMFDDELSALTFIIQGYELVSGALALAS